MEIIKNEDHVLFRNSKGEYHLSLEDFKKLGKKKALEFATKEIEKKLSSKFKGKTINFEQARNLGFCDQGIKNFCWQLGLDIDENHDLLKMHTLLDDSKLELLFKYPQEILKLFGLDVFIKNEKAIARSSKHSYYYAQKILKSRFENGEKAIAESAAYSYLYARYVIKGRFEVGEEAIAESAAYSYWYARDILKSRFEIGERAISENVKWSYLYALYVLKSRLSVRDYKHCQIITPKALAILKDINA